jgi:hypothetical protein
LEQQVQHLAERVNEIVIRALGKDSPLASNQPENARKLHN